MPASEDVDARVSRIGSMLDDIHGLIDRGGVQEEEDSRPNVLGKQLAALQANAAGRAGRELLAQIDDLEQEAREILDALVATRKRDEKESAR